MAKSQSTKEGGSAIHCVAMELRLQVVDLHDPAAGILIPKAAVTNGDQRTMDFPLKKRGINPLDAPRANEDLDQLEL